MNFQQKNIGGLWLAPLKRERKGNYSVDAYYKQAMRAPQQPKLEKGPRQLKAPKQQHMYVVPTFYETLSFIFLVYSWDHHFAPTGLDALYKKEALHYRVCYSNVLVRFIR